MKATSHRSGPPSAAHSPEAGPVPQFGAATVPVPAAAAAKLDPLRHSLQHIDGTVQNYAERIRAICRAAQARLSVNPSALRDVHVLLDAVCADIGDLENQSNCEAASHEADYVDLELPGGMKRFFPAAGEVNHG